MGLAITLGAAVATDASAEPTTNTIAVEIANCPVDATEVRRIAALELRAPVAPSASTTIHVECSGTTATVRVVDSLTQKTLERSITFATIAPIARSRLFALAIADLVSASWAELELSAVPVPSANVATPYPARETNVQAAVAAVERRRAPRSTSFDLYALFALRRWTTGWTSYGGGLGLDYRTRSSGLSLGARVGIGLERGSVGTPIGDVSADIYDAQLVASIVYGFRAHTLRGGGGIRTGVVRACGSPATEGVSGRCDAAVYAGPIAEAAWTMALGTISIVLRLETGLAASPVRALADGEGSADARSVWIGGALGAGFAF